MAVSLYKEVYVESGWNLSSESLVALPPGDRLPTALQRMVAGVELGRGLQTQTKAYDETLRQQSVNHVLLAFHQLRIPKLLDRGKPMPLVALIEFVSIHKRFYQLTKHLLTQLEVEGFLSSTGSDTWRLLTPFPERDWLEAQVTKGLKELLDSYPERRPFLNLWNNCCRALPQILRSECDPREHLFPEAVSAPLETMDTQAGTETGCEGADFWYAQMPEVQWRNEALKTIMEQLQIGHKARVLELSMGRDTATTRRLLSAIARELDTSFTVANPSIEHLRIIETHLQEGPPAVRTQPMNIEYDPKLQGFVPKSYDLVVAINCFHSTKSVKNALRNVRQLLKSNGLLIICERTQPSLGLDLTFGLLGDWWRFDEGDRPYPLLHHEQWTRLLSMAGFEVTAAFENPESVFVVRHRHPSCKPLASPSPTGASAGLPMPTLPLAALDCRRGSRSSRQPASVAPWILVSNEVAVRESLEKLLQTCGCGDGFCAGASAGADSAMILSSVEVAKAAAATTAPLTYAGVVCICKDSMEPLLQMAEYWLSISASIETKFIIVLIVKSYGSGSGSSHKNPLFDGGMSRHLAQLLAGLVRDESGSVKASACARTMFTLIEAEDQAEGQVAATSTLAFQVFKELWAKDNPDNWTYRYGSQGREFERGFLRVQTSDLDEDDRLDSSGTTGGEAVDYVIIQDEEWASADTLPRILAMLPRPPSASARTTTVTFKLSASTLDTILYEIFQLHARSPDLRIVLTTTEVTSVQLPLIFSICEALTHYRRRKGLRGNLIKIGSVDGEDPTVIGAMLAAMPESAFGKQWTLTVVETNMLHDGGGGKRESGGDGDGVGHGERRAESPESSIGQSSSSPYSHLISIRRSISHGATGARRKSSLETLLVGKSATEQLNLVRELVLESVCQVTGLSTADFEETQGFQDIGLDSVNIRDLAVRLGRAFALDLQPTSIFDHPTPQQLMEYILDAICVDDDPIRNARRQSSYVLFDEDIAIVGASCRVGSATTLDGFWKLLADGADCIRPVPPSRFDYEKYKDLIYNHYGSFLDDIAGFDCNFFQISPNEAEVVDPQQRLLLQLTWEALENAGIPPDSLEGSKSSVFIGMCNSDYQEVVQVPPDAPPGAYLVTSNLNSVTAGRISYFLGIHGTSVCIDTACSSSLVAIDLACAALRAEESPLAIVGGINLICSPLMYVKYCGAKMLSRGRVCRPFDDSADGLVRGEAGVVLVLKRLTEALTDGDSVLGVIRGTGTNQDGASAGLTAPNGQAQAALIRRVMKKANLRPCDVGYIEAHGTGTALGDPIEINALETIFGRGGGGKGSGAGTDTWKGGGKSAGDGSLPLYIGSVKANVGHTEGTAGILGLLKVCLAIKHGRIPPQINVTQLNRQITDPGFFQLPRQGTRWDWNKVGCVSSFGVSGTNAFAVVEQPPDYSRFRQQWSGANVSSLPSTFLFTVSGKTSSALAKLLDAYQALSSSSSLPAGAANGSNNPFNQQEHFAAAAYTSNVGRSHFRYRAAVVARDVAHFREQLAAKSFFRSSSSSQQQHHAICFQFTGQGSHYKGMGKELYERSPHFRQVYDDCASALEDHSGPPHARSILDIFSEDDADAAAVLGDPVLSQLALFSLEYSLARFWMTLGLQPTYLLGHSLGEYVAAAVAEVLSLEDALKLVQLRARLINARVPRGAAGMLAVTVSSKQAMDELVRETVGLGDGRQRQGRQARISVSAYNSTSQVVLSGPLELLKQKQQEGLGNSRNGGAVLLNVPYAYHSPQMEAIVDEFRQQLTNLSVTFSKPKINIVSTVTGSSQTEFDIEHWIRHLVGPVHFLQAVQHLSGPPHGCATFLEVGPKPVLSSFCRDILTKDVDVGTAPSLTPNLYCSMKQGESNWTTILNTIAQLYVGARTLNFKELYPHRLAKTELPSYPFENIRCWSTRSLEPTPTPGQPSQSNQIQNFHTPPTPAPPTKKQKNGQLEQQYAHPLTGACAARTKKHAIWESALDCGQRPHAYLRGHAFLGKIILPGAAFVEMALEAALETTSRGTRPASRQRADAGLSVRLSSFTIALPLVLEPQNAVPVQTIATPSSALAPSSGSGSAVSAGTLEINSCSPANFSESTALPEWRTFVTCGYQLTEEGAPGALVSARIDAIQARLTRCADVSAVWAHFASTEGVEFGPTFKMIRGLWTGANEGLAEVALDLPDAEETRGYNVHPVVLDNAFQSVFAPLIVAGSPLIKKPFMVSSIGMLTFRGRGPCPLHVFVHVTRLEAVDDNITADIAILDPSTGEPCLEVQGFHGQATTRDHFARLTSSELVSDGLYEETWRQTGGRRAQPPLGTVLATLAEKNLLEEFMGLPQVGENDFYEELCLHYIAVCMQGLGIMDIFKAVEGRGLSTAAFCELAGVQPIHAALVDHFFRQLGLESVNVGNEASFEWSLPSAARSSLAVLAAASELGGREGLKRRVLAHNPGRALFGLVNVCGEQLAGVLRGDVNPLELLFPVKEEGDERASAEAVYKESPGINQGNDVLYRLLGKSLDSLAQKGAAAAGVRADGFELRILEVGAGTGSTSMHILKSLREAAASRSGSGFSFSYTYTDISASFFIAAEAAFGGSEQGMLYRVLNIEEDPLQQGFVPFSYDLIVGANVLHATRHIPTTVANARKLLRPHGLLLILEATAPALSLDLTFGLTDGWWRFYGHDELRPEYPLMRCNTWEHLLLRSGFSRVQYIEMEESIILGTANELGEYCAGVDQRPTTTLPSAVAPAPKEQWLIVWFENKHSELLKLIRSVAAGVDVIQVQAASIRSWVPPPQLGAVIFDAGSCEDVKLLSETLLALVQTIINTGTVILHKFLVRTRGAIAVGVADTGHSANTPASAITNGPHPGDLNPKQQQLLQVENPFQAILWGMCRTIRTEHPELKCVNIECGSGSNSSAWLEALQEVYTADDEGMVVRHSESTDGCDGGARKVARLTHLLSLPSASPSPKKEEPLFKPDRTYLITGGLGGLGMSLVQWMHAHGARHFCLLARRVPQSPQPLPSALNELPNLRLKVLQCDVTELAALDQAIGTVEPPLAGIFHLAGALADAAVLHQSWDTLQVTYGPKVYGTWNLHQVTVQRRLVLDHFVLFSSLASLIGSGGQVNHASANAFMDAVAHFRVAKGLPAISINWGVWAQIGSAQGRKLIRGLRGFSPEAAYSVLELGLRARPGHTQFGVSLFDWSVYDTRDSTWYAEVVEAASGKKKMDATLPRADGLAREEPEAAAAAAGRSEAAAGPPATQKEMQKAIVGVLKKLTGFSNIAMDAPFRQLGIDSLMVIELRNRLQTLLKLTLPMTLMNEHPNVQALSSKLLVLTTQTGDQSPTPTVAGKENSAPKVKPPPVQVNKGNGNKQLNNANTDDTLPNSRKYSPEARSVQSEFEVPKRTDTEQPTPTLTKRISVENPAAIAKGVAGEINGLGVGIGLGNEDVRQRNLTRKRNSIEQPAGGLTSISPSVSGDRPSWEPKDVAVIGMACKIGGADSPDEFWEMLIGGKHSVTRVPSTRRELASYFEEEGAGTGMRPFGSFISDHDRFDHDFFYVTPREARLMDPQQRLLLQLTWHALEDAGIPPGQLKGSKTGLFIGVSGHDYAHLLTRAGSEEEKDGPFLALLGNAHCIAAGRISQILGLQGPSMAVDTACSSSLVALHLGVQALRTGQADTVLVGGSNLLLSHDKYVGYDRGGLLSSDGLTQSFDAGASGFVRGEGVAVVVLKRAADYDDSCLAIIKGSAVTHSGVGAGLGAPAGGAQVQLLQEALLDARTAASDVEYVEAQGAGSKLGDALEVNALEAVFGNGRERPLVLGTAKPNVGHLEACSGLAGLVKVIMSMAHRRVPPVLNLQILNPDINNTRFFNIPRQATRWPSENPTMLAGLASMGYSGTNAFAIIQNGMTKHRAHNRARMLPPPLLFPLSARSEPALRALMLSYHEYLLAAAAAASVAGQPEDDEDSTLLPCMAFSLTATREHHSEFRHVILAGSKDELLHQIKIGTSASHTRILGCPEATLFQIDGAFYFPPHLYEAVPLFAKYRAQLSSSAAAHGFRIQDLLAAAAPHDGRSGNLILYEYSSQFILVAALLELGVIPEAISGTGIGELVAAVHTGLIALDDSWRLVKAAAGLKKEVSFSRADSNEWDGVSGLQVQQQGSADRISGRELNAGYGGQIQFKPESPLPSASDLAAPPAHSHVAVAGGIGKTRYWVEKCRGAGARGRDRLAHGSRQPLTIFLSDDEEGVPSTLRPTPTASVNKLVIEDFPSLIAALGELYQKGMKVKLELLYDAAEYERLSLPPYPFQGTAHWYK